MLSYDLDPPTLAYASECRRAIHIRGIERQRRGDEPFSTGKAVGGPISYDSTETVVLYVIYYTVTHFSTSVVQ